MTELFHQVRKYVGLSTDTKPTAAVNNCTIGSTFYEYDTGILYITYDGTNWVQKHEPDLQRIRIALEMILGQEVEPIDTDD